MGASCGSASPGCTWRRTPASWCTRAARPGRIAGADHSLVDFNRGGTPLVEIVSEPDISTPDQARTFLTQLRSLVQQLDVSDVNMEEGSLRCDANVSVRLAGQPFGTKTELKNMNSFRFLQRGLESEIERQIDTLETGGRVVQETVHFDPNTGRVSSLRSKEEAHDYRYFPEPDLPPIELDAEYVEQVRASLPELPAARKERIAEQYGLTAKEAALLAANKPLGDYFETLAGITGDPRVSVNWVLGDLSAYLNTSGLEVADCPVQPSGSPSCSPCSRTARSPARWPRKSSRPCARAGSRPGRSSRRRAWGRSPTRARWKPSWPASWRPTPDRPRSSGRAGTRSWASSWAR